MAYTRTQWVEQETPLSAQNMNNIEDGIEELQSTKVDKATGKGLSDQNYTAAEKTKLAGIAEGAEVNVQPDWNQTNTSADDYIKNKPGNASSSAAGLMSAADKSKLDGVQAGAQVNRTYTAVTGKPTGNAAPGFGGTVTVSQVSQDANGQVSVTDRNILFPGNDATETAHGLMSPTDKAKLNTVAVGAERNRTYTAVSGYPTSNVAPGFGQTAAVSQVSQDENGQIALTHRTITIPNKVATTAAPGLMSAADKTKLNSIMDMAIVTGTTDTSAGIPASGRKTLTYKLDSRKRYSYAIPLKLSVPSGCAIGGYYPTTETEGVYTYITALNVNVINTDTSAKSVPSGTTMPILLLG